MYKGTIFLFNILSLLWMPAFAMVSNLKETKTLAELSYPGIEITKAFIEMDTQQFVAEIPMGVVVNEGGILSQDGYIITDFQTSYRDQHHRLLRPKRNIDGENPLFFQGRLAMISSPGSENWYHWLLQILPRLAILKKSRVDFDRIYINNVRFLWQEKALYAVLKHLQIDPEKLLIINGDCIVKATVLIVPSVPFVPAKGTLFPQWMGQHLKDVFLDPQQKSAPTYDTLYIARGKASTRRITNETALIEALEEQGVHTVYLEDLSPHTQAHLFHHARTIIAPHGSGLANIVFSQPGVHVIEIDHGCAIPRTGLYRALTQGIEGQHTPYYVGHVSEENLDTDMTLDLPHFLAFLKTHGQNKG
jgi:capsular polysaccharide biosynthesis protein